MGVGALSIIIGVILIFLSGFRAGVRGVNPFQLGWGFVLLGALILG